MGKREKVLLGWILALGGVGSALLLVGTVVITPRPHQFGLSLSFAIAAAPFLVSVFILSRIYSRVSQERISQLAEAMDRLSLSPAQASDYQWLDLGKIERWASEFELLGFSALGDYSIGAGEQATDALKLSQSFTRLMASGRQRCYAEVGQTCSPETGPKDVVCAVVTFFTSGQQCRTSNGANPDAKLAQVLPGPIRELGMNLSTQPGASPDELLQVHLEQRDKMAAERGLVTQPDVSYEAYRLESRKQLDAMGAWADRFIAEAASENVRRRDGLGL